jgi:hypothetical protein
VRGDHALAQLTRRRDGIERQRDQRRGLAVFVARAAAGDALRQMDAKHARLVRRCCPDGVERRDRFVLFVSHQ